MIVRGALPTVSSVAFMCLWLVPAAHADPGDGPVETSAQDGGIGVGVTVQTEASASDSGASSSSITPVSATEGIAAGVAGTGFACVGGSAIAGVDTCPEAEAADEPQLTLGMVRSAFEQVPLPPSRLVVQPPDGTTLVNFDTNFYTESEGLLRTVTLLGQRVDLDITPARFTWRFGDGRSRSTATPGSPYPRLDVTHAYLRKGRVRASVDTTYTAQFRVNGGPWQPVPGSVTIAGTSVSLRVVTATPQLVAY